MMHCNPTAKFRAPGDVEAGVGLGSDESSNLITIGSNGRLPDSRRGFELNE
jgi:hypothetical protein